MTVRIVADTAADLPSALVAQHGIELVPLTVRFGSDSYLSGVELGTDEFWQKLEASNEPPATAAPSAGDFQSAYRKVIDEGATGIVSVHLSAKLSATYQSAVVAANEITDVPIEVVDSYGVSASTGLQALRAAELAADGASPGDIVTELDAMRRRTHVVFVIDTLEYLRMGGRIGGAQALLGTMLKMKPVLSLQDGTVEPVGRVRTRTKALDHLAGLVKEHEGSISRLVVVQGQAEDVDHFRGLLAGVVDIPPEDIWALGPVVGTHAGPGVIGVVFLTSS